MPNEEAVFTDADRTDAERLRAFAGRSWRQRETVDETDR
jgi:hypothetical protein